MIFFGIVQKNISFISLFCEYILRYVAVRQINPYKFNKLDFILLHHTKLEQEKLVLNN